MSEIPEVKREQPNAGGVPSTGNSEIPVKSEPLKEKVVVPPEIFWCEKCNPPKQFTDKKKFADHKRYHDKKEEAEAAKSKDSKLSSGNCPKISDGTMVKLGSADGFFKGEVRGTSNSGEVSGSPEVPGPGIMGGLLNNDKLPLIVLAFITVLGLGIVGLSFKKKNATRQPAMRREPQQVIRQVESKPADVQAALDATKDTAAKTLAVEVKQSTNIGPPMQPAFLR